MPIFYQSFLIRIWNNHAPAFTGWHASLENPSTHEVILFNHPDELFKFLSQLGEHPTQSHKEERKNDPI